MEITVKYLQSIDFAELKYSDQLEIKTKGRPMPHLSIEQRSTDRLRRYGTAFSKQFYENCEWLCGCEETNAMFCFPCLLFGGDLMWTKMGVRDLIPLAPKIKHHEQTSDHINSVIDLALLGKVSNAGDSDSSQRLLDAKHNELVRKNRDALSRIIDCVKFCGKYKLSLFNSDEGGNGNHGGIFHGLLDFACELDSCLKAHLATEAVFKEKMDIILNEILDIMLSICRDKIKEEVSDLKYLAVVCDEAVDTYDNNQVAVILKYVAQDKPIERFWGFFNPDTLERVLLNELHILCGSFKEKLIAQTYDGITIAGAVSKGLPKVIKEVYRNAHFVSYARQPCITIERAVSQNSSARAFFASLSGIYNFFERCPHRMAALENVAISQSKTPHVVTRFKQRIVNAVYELKFTLVQCCNMLETSTSVDTGCGAASINRTLNDAKFDYWLRFFCKVMPHISIQFSVFHSHMFNRKEFSASFAMFRTLVLKLKSDSEAIRNRFLEVATAVKEVCDIILMECSERMKFTAHLYANKLLSVCHFQAFAENFPNEALSIVGDAYPMLEMSKLRIELLVLYKRGDLCKTESLVHLLFAINENHLQSTLSETVKLIKILLTTPMITAEPDRQLTTLARIQSFLQCSRVRDRLSALAMIFIEHEMVTEMKDFNEKVVDHFATSSGWTEFTFK
ncbi:uncharacterized protein [Macrobrachium rosenbergii]|uniref:uncharacterized protein isoform X1 n=1 Tax=Macrobrachium rosenbergii TaxID=79674 RepID=UPI0034D4BC6E